MKKNCGNCFNSVFIYCYGRNFKEFNFRVNFFSQNLRKCNKDTFHKMYWIYMFIEDVFQTCINLPLVVVDDVVYCYSIQLAVDAQIPEAYGGVGGEAVFIGRSRDFSTHYACVYYSNHGICLIHHYFFVFSIEGLLWKTGWLTLWSSNKACMFSVSFYYVCSSSL